MLYQNNISISSLTIPAHRSRQYGHDPSFTIRKLGYARNMHASFHNRKVPEFVRQHEPGRAGQF